MQGSSQVIAEPIIRDYGVKALVTLLWTNKFFITLMTIVFAIVSVVVALNLPNKYQSEVLLDYVRKTEGGLGGGSITDRPVSKFSRAVIRLWRGR